MLGNSVISEDDFNDSQPSTSSTSCGLDMALKQNSSNGLHLTNHSIVFKQMIAMHPQPSEPCAYLHRVCQQPRIDGYQYCNRHILMDKNAPFKQCSFLHPQSQRRCPIAARKLDRHDSKVLCDEHLNYKAINKGIENFKQQFMIPHPDGDNGHDLSAMTPKVREQYLKLKRQMDHVENYCPLDDNDNMSTFPKHNRTKKDWEINPEDKTIVMHRSFEEKKYEAFCQVLYGNKRKNIDPMSVKVNQISTSDDFENDTMSWTNSDPLRYAGHLSLGDIENSLQEKFLKIKQIQFLLAKARPEMFALESEYKILKNHEKSLTSSSSSLSSSSLSVNHSFNVSTPTTQSNSLEGNEHNTVTPTSSFPSSTIKVPVIGFGGDDAGGFLETIEERNERLNSTIKPPSVCVFQKEKDKCSGQALPLSKYCQKHILYDISQCLFRPCGAQLGEPAAGSCLEPIVPYTTKRTCTEHITLKYSNEDIENCGMKISTSFDDTTVAEDDAFIAAVGDEKTQTMPNESVAVPVLENITVKEESDGNTYTELFEDKRKESSDVEMKLDSGVVETGNSSALTECDTVVAIDLDS